MFCYNCGAEIGEGAIFCRNCGSKVASQDTVIPESGSQESDMSKQAGKQYGDIDEFRTYVDNFVCAKTRKKSALELMEGHDYFVFICLGAPVVLAILTLIVSFNPVGALLLMGFGFLVSWLVVYIRNLTLRLSGWKVPKNINLDELMGFLNGHLEYLSPYFNEWGYIKYKNQEKSVGGSVVTAGLISGMDGVLSQGNPTGLISGVNAGFMLSQGYYASMNNELMRSAVLCTSVGEKKDLLLVIYVKPDKNADSGQLFCSIGIERRCRGGEPFLSAGPNSDHLGFATHTCLIKIVPVMRAAMEYYLKNMNMGAK